ncbi:MepB family protein [Lactococcus lactis]|uniref:MepB family protein n=1 Tax=Lactococcus lactis TaxID=1358 RepID=UPI00071DEEFD|nr:MepB family protein [Lactococcus lactis]
MKSINILKDSIGNFEILNYEEQNSEYEGMVIQLASNNKIVRSRLAKKIPKKDGHFVAFWEKDSQNVNHPFSELDSIEVLLILINDEDKRGIFLIPKEVAVKNRILSNENQKGKMAMGFYPSWCKNLNSTA